MEETESSIKFFQGQKFVNFATNLATVGGGDTLMGTSEF